MKVNAHVAYGLLDAGFTLKEVLKAVVDLEDSNLSSGPSSSPEARTKPPVSKKKRRKKEKEEDLG